MSNEFERYYELLGVAPGTSGNELKEAYRDMAKVWHPDRFSHDPRLQQKAQERLKEINEAYEQLTSGKAARRTRPTATTAEPHSPMPATTARHSKRPRLILLTAAAFCAVFIAALIALVPTGAGRAGEQTPPSEQEAQPARDARQPDGAAGTPAAQSTRGRERASRQPNAEATTDAGPSAPPPRPMPTVTVTVDTATGLRATRDCPAVSRMTYPAGREPQQYCGVAHEAKTAGVIRDARTPGADKLQDR